MKTRSISEFRKPGFQFCAVVANEEIAHNTWYLRLRPQTPFSFAPGQFVVLTTADSAKTKRAYSIAGTDGDNLHFVFKRVENGILTNHLARLKPGDAVQAQGPYGQFALQPTERPKLFMATGVGLAPFATFLDALLNSPSHVPVRLLFGVRYPEEIFWEERFCRLAALNPNFDYRIIVSRPDANWTGSRGRITQHLDAVPGLADSECYLCGSQAMIQDASALLRQSGVPAEQIFYEKFY